MVRYPLGTGPKFSIRLIALKLRKKTENVYIKTKSLQRIMTLFFVGSQLFLSDLDPWNRVILNYGSDPEGQLITDPDPEGQLITVPDLELDNFVIDRNMLTNRYLVNH